MLQKEHDGPDPSLIVGGSWHQVPLKHVQGKDYPITPLEELRERQTGQP